MGFKEDGSEEQRDFECMVSVDLVGDLNDRRKE